MRLSFIIYFSFFDQYTYIQRNINGPFTVTVSPLDSNHTFTNLSGGYTYTFKVQGHMCMYDINFFSQVRAFTSAGYGNNATTFITIPSAGTNII